MDERNWIDIEPGKYSLSEYEVSKKVIHLLRHSQKVHREEDGAVHVWRMKENLQNSIPTIYTLGLTVDGKHAWQEEEEIRNDSSPVLIL